MYYIETSIKELGLDNCSTPTGNSNYTSCQMSSEDIVNTIHHCISCLDELGPVHMIPGHTPGQQLPSVHMIIAGSWQSCPGSTSIALGQPQHHGS